MIHVIESKNPHLCISAISENKASIEIHLDALPEEAKGNSKLLELDLSYPFWILEKKGFKFFDENNILEALKLANEELKDSQDVFNIYLIQEDFFSDEPGKDEMGILQHQHFDKEETERIIQGGISTLKKSFNLK